MASKQTFKIFISEVEYSQYIMYPVSVTDKNLEESLNLGEITLSRMSQSEPFKPNRIVFLETWVDGVKEEESDYLIMSDLVTKIGFTDLYEHKLTLIEYTHLLDQVTLPNFSITRTLVGYEPTLLDVAARIRDLVTELTGEIFFFEQDTQDVLDAIESPEWTFVRKTALECYRAVFGYAKIVPEAFITKSYIGETLITVNSMRHVSILADLEQAIEGFSLKKEGYNPATYKTALYSSIENMVTGEYDSIIEPANGWLSPRSADKSKIQNDTGELYTSRPIYKILDFQIARWMAIGKPQANNNIRWITVPHSIIPIEWYDGLAPEDFIYEKDYWDTKDNTEVYGEKGGSFYYEKGKKNVKNMTYIPPAKWGWIPTEQAYVSVLDAAPSHTWAMGMEWIKTEYRTEARTLAEAYWLTQYTDDDPDSSWLSQMLFYEGEWINATLIPDGGLANLQFRVEYVPLVNTNLYTFRERKFNDDDEVLSFQNYNQQATVINSDVLGNLHDEVIKRGSGTSLSLVYLHKDYSDILPIGRRIDDYVITSIDFTYSQYGIKTIYNLDKYYAKLQKYLAVLEEYRQYAIPNDNIVTRQKTINKFAKFATTAENGDATLSASLFIDDNTAEVNLMKFSNTALVTTNFAFNNSLTFEATFENNSSAGPQSIAYDTNTNTRVHQPTIYVDTYGRIEGNKQVIFGRDFSAFDADDSYALPSYSGNLNKEFYNESNIWFEKDAREILAISLQVHHLDTTGAIYINKGLAKQNGLTGGAGLNDSLVKACFFDVKPHTTKIIASSAAYDVQSRPFGTSNNSIVLGTPRNNTASTKAAWGYVKDLEDGTYEILFWVDESTEPSAVAQQYYINFDNSY